jgi:hypothetical protein
LVLDKKPQASHSQNEAPSQTLPKLTLGAKKKPPTTQPLSLKRPSVPTKLQRKTTPNKPRIKGRLEVILKINQLPNWVETLKNNKQRICLNASGRIIQMDLRPKVWNKLIKANQEYPLWTAAIVGKAHVPKWL